MWQTRRRRPVLALLLALLESSRCLIVPRPAVRGPNAPRPAVRAPRPRGSARGPGPLCSTPANVRPLTGGAGDGNLPPGKFTPGALSGKYENPRDAHRAAAKMRRDAESAFLDRPRDALELYRRATALAPSHSAMAWLRLARLHRQFKDPSSARAALRRGTQHLPRDARLWRALAQACQYAGDVEGARQHYGVVVRLDADFVAGWDAWSRLELREGNPVRAAALAKKGLAKVGAFVDGVQPQQSERLWHAYALALAAGGGVDAQGAVLRGPAAGVAAEAVLRKAVGLHPEHSHLRHALGVQLYRKGDVDAARKELRRAALRGHDEALLSLARLEEEAGRGDEARTAYKRACGLIKRSPGTHDLAPDSKHAAPWVAWARFEEDCGHVEAAAALCRRASVRFPRDADVHAQWARLEPDMDRAREIIFAGLEGGVKNQAKLYKALGELEATLAAQYVVRDCAVQGLHTARKAFYDGARASGGDELVQLVFAWAHCEWALAQALNGVSPTGASRARKLFVWSARLARRKAPRAAPWVSLGRARFELSLGRDEVARRAAARAVRFSRRERDAATEADAWRVLYALERDSDKAAVYADRALRADARDAANRAPDHPLARQWRNRAVPLDETFGCHAERWDRADEDADDERFERFEQSLRRRD